MRLSYQLCTFQGSRASLFAFNHKGHNGGYALFDNFTVDEPMADRSADIPYGRTFRIINLATASCHCHETRCALRFSPRRQQSAHPFPPY